MKHEESSGGRVLRRGDRRAFTLVELLVVVGLMGLILAVTLASFQNSSGGAKINSSVMQLKSALTLARQYAVSRRTRVYVVFPTPSCTFPLAGDSDQMAYQSYNIYAPSIGYMHEWGQLPNGVVFNPSITGVSGASVNVFSDTSDVTANVTAKDPSSTAMPCVRFKPNGSLDSSNQNIGIFLSEGICRGGTNFVMQANRRTQYIVMKPLTGMMELEEM
jgi:prepilin-type N-terminal cleavage/methylation domain-containing protein